MRRARCVDRIRCVVSYPSIRSSVASQSAVLLCIIALADRASIATSAWTARHAWPRAAWVERLPSIARDQRTSDTTTTSAAEVPADAHEPPRIRRIQHPRRRVNV
jgi:hypothetical protein